MPASSDPTSFSYGTPAGPDTGDLTGATSTNSLGGIFNSGSTSALQTLSIVITNILSDNKKIAFEPYNNQYTLSDGTTGYSALHYATVIENTGLDALANVNITSIADNQIISYDTSTSKWVNSKVVFNNIDAAVAVTESEGIGSNDNDTTFPTSAAVKDYVDTNVTAQDLDFSGDSGGAQSIDLDSQSLTLTGGTGIDTTGSSQTMTFAIDSTVATLAGSQTLTNKSIDSANNTITNIVNADIKSDAAIAITKLASSSVNYGGVTLSLGGSDTTPAFDLTDATNYPTTSLTGTITNAQLAGSIANAKLSNSTVSYGGVSLALGASDATPAFDLTDATNYPTSSLSGTITNAQLAGSIANAKLANSTVSYGGISLALGASDATPAFDLADATNYPTSSLSGTITNAQLAGSIANAKLANSSITVSDGSSSTATALGGTITFAGTTNEVEVGEASGTITVGLPNNVTIAGNLTVNGDTTTVNTATLSVEDPLIKLANGNNAADSVDIGFYGLYDTSGSQDLYAGLFRDANDSGKFKLFKDLQAEPNTTVNTGGTGYATGTLVATLEGNADTATTSTNITASNNTTDETVYLTFVDGATGTQGIETNTSLNYNPATNVLSAGTFNGSLSGTATTATNITATANNTANETVYPTFVDGVSGTQGIETDSGLTYNPSTGLLTSTAFAGNITGDVTGNAATATALANARTINGTSFDGTANITVTAAAGTLTGGTLNSGVTASSLTSVGTIATGVWNGTAIADSYISSASTWNAKQAALTFGIANTNAVKIDDADAADNDYAKLTASGIEGKSYAEVKTDLSLNNVENTAVSTWAGTSNITTTGTIGTGTWGATDVAIAHGGTGSSTASGARTNLGLGTAAVLNSVDEDDMNSNSATLLPTQQSVKAYVDANAGSSGVTVEDEGSALSNAGTTLDFVGAGVTASGTGSTKTITIPGGAGSVAADDITTGDAAVTIATSSGNITIDAQANNSDIIFKGTDGGSDITALTLDMSNNGTAIFNKNINLDSDSSVIKFGDDQDVTLTHVHDTGLKLNSTSQLQFGDSGTYIHQSADGVLDLVSDTEIEINATTIDINGAVDISGNLDVGGNITANVDADAHAEIGRAHIGYIGTSDSAGFSHIDRNTTTGYALRQTAGGVTHLNGVTGQSIRFNMANSEIARIDDSAFTVGVDDTGHDVKFFGATSGKYMEWDESADQLDVTGSFDVTGNSTMSGTVNINGATGTAQLQVNLTDTTTYNHSIKCYNPNMTQGQYNQFHLGESGGSYNTGVIGYRWDSAGSASNNYLEIGHWSNGDLIKVYGDKVEITDPLTATSITTSGNIELGHASDTTISRSAAGVVQIEGNTILNTANADVGATTTSSSDVDHVLINDGGVLKKITVANLGTATTDDATALAIALG